MQLDRDYWQHRYQEKTDTWDIGYPSTPLKEYIDQLQDKSLRILIPGCGNAYEAEYLHEKGFTNVCLLDISDLALKQFLQRVPQFPQEHLINEDFFLHHGKYDLILEQTFFCALDPSLRADYVKKMHELLSPDGKLSGLLFNFTFSSNPPFGGNEEEYRQLFDPYFHTQMETAYNSIPPRAGRELFFIAKPKPIA